MGVLRAGLARKRRRHGAHVGSSRPPSTAIVHQICSHVSSANVSGCVALMPPPNWHRPSSTCLNTAHPLTRPFKASGRAACKRSPLTGVFAITCSDTLRSTWHRASQRGPRRRNLISPAPPIASTQWRCSCAPRPAVARNRSESGRFRSDLRSEHLRLACRVRPQCPRAPGRAS